MIDVMNAARLARRAYEAETLIRGAERPCWTELDRATKDFLIAQTEEGLMDGDGRHEGRWESPYTLYGLSQTVW